MYKMYLFFLLLFFFFSVFFFSLFCFSFDPAVAYVRTASVRLHILFLLLFIRARGAHVARRCLDVFSRCRSRHSRFVAVSFLQSRAYAIVQLMFIHTWFIRAHLTFCSFRNVRARSRPALKRFTFLMFA